MAWRCPTCKDYVENDRLSCPACGVSRSGAPVAAAGSAPDPRRDLAMEGHLRATAFWYRAFALLGGGLLVLGWLRGDGEERSLVGSIVAAAVCAGALLLGNGLARLSSGARVAAGLLTLLSLGGTVLSILRGNTSGWIGTAISLAWTGAYLWLFFSPRSRAVTTPAYRRVAQLGRAQAPRIVASPFFWLPLIAIGAVILMMVLFLGAAALSFN